MIDPNNVPPVKDDELLARFATQSSQFRSSDNTVKQDLFIPNSRGTVRSCDTATLLSLNYGHLVTT